jgi:S1-C subfamily serine protease
MSELPPSGRERWRQRWQQFRLRVRQGVPFVAGVVAALIAVLIYNAAAPKPHQITQNDINTSIANAIASITPAPAYSELVYQVIHPSLVLVVAQGTTSDGKPDKSLGSGVIVNERGDILTSLHVISGSQDIQLTFADGTQSDAIIMVRDSQNDIAVLRATRPPAQIVPAVLGNPNAMQIGDEVYAVGNPFGLYGSMSSGVISGLHRIFQMPNSTQKLQNMIQFDAAVNPGNSGGPLLNRAGEVVGIVTGLLNPTEQDFFVGIGFAVPITTAGGAAGLPPD